MFLHRTLYLLPTKLVKGLDKLITKYGEKSSQTKTFLGDIARELRATNHGSNSQYATFDIVNGKIVTIRLADHNAKVSTIDNHDEEEGISIVVSAKGNLGIANDGKAHVVEFFYDAIKLRKADNKPLFEILKSIKQSLYSGEFKDNTGLAEKDEANRIEDLAAAKKSKNKTRLSVAQQKVDNAKSIAELADAIAEREQIKREGARFAVRSGRSLRDEYDRRTRRPTKNNDVRWYSNFFRRMAESYQDSMHAFKVLQDLVAEETGKPIEGFENAYWAENRMSSMNKAQQEAYERDFITPLYAEIDKLQKAGANYQEILDYLFAKHGLERNEVFAQREGKVRDYSGLSALT